MSKRHSSRQGLTQTQLQRFMSLVAIHNNISPLLQKYVITDLINGLFIEFKDDKFVITNSGIKEIDRLLFLSKTGNYIPTEKQDARISTSISS
mgnify:CR=1 FL=1|jgi:hypothetical protein|tara:strand:+ start:47 stop:325 length:279 start_codon:yes stop_codon:yes gene_type:complete